MDFKIDTFLLNFYLLTF